MDEAEETLPERRERLALQPAIDTIHRDATGVQACWDEFNAAEKGLAQKQIEQKQIEQKQIEQKQIEQ